MGVVHPELALARDSATVTWVLQRLKGKQSVGCLWVGRGKFRVCPDWR